MIQRNKIKKTLHVPNIFQAPQEKRLNIWPKIVTYLTLVTIFTILFTYAVFFSPWFKIKNIEIIGSPSEQIKEDLNSLVAKNLFSFKSEKIETRLMNIDQNYTKIKVFRGIPDTVRVVFEDRVPKIIWQINSQQFFVDQDAIAFKNVDNEIKIPIVIDSGNLNIKVPTQIASKSFIDFVVLADIELSKINFKILNYEVSETTFQVVAVSENGPKLLLSTLRPLSEQIDALSKVYETNKQDIKEYIDLRVEGKVYYK